MSCYTKEQLKLYKAGFVEEQLWQEITAHLYSCEQCSAFFLKLLSAEEIKQAEELLPSDFTMKVKTALQEEKANFHRKKSPSRERLREKRQSLFFYYVGAAVVTLIFMSGGLFQKMIDIPPLIASVTEIERKDVVETDKCKFNLPARAVDKATIWLDSFVAKEKGGN